MAVRLMRPEELPRVTAMMRALWPSGDSYDFSDETVLVWAGDDDAPDQPSRPRGARIRADTACSVFPKAASVTGRLRLPDETHRPARDAIRSDDGVAANLADEDFGGVSRVPVAQQRELDATVARRPQQATR